VEIDDIARLTRSLAGVRQTVVEGLAQWRYHGRLVARQLDTAHAVIRTDFDYRDAMVRQFPGTFSVPDRYLKHMMVVAVLTSGSGDAMPTPSKRRGSFRRALTDNSVPSD
jgi:hypothetical protein